MSTWTPEQPDPHMAWYARDDTADPAGELPLHWLVIVHGWGIQAHDPPEVEGAVGRPVVEVWRPDAAPHIGRPAAACPVCSATIDAQQQRIDAGLPPTGMTEPREATTSLPIP